jgi:1-phosphatidylinositol-3-phosphate 5-kinase
MTDLIDKKRSYLAYIFIGKKHWIPDNKVKSCFHCGSDFILLLRSKHHCRLCGKIFCAKYLYLSI